MAVSGSKPLPHVVPPSILSSNLAAVGWVGGVGVGGGTLKDWSHTRNVSAADHIHTCLFVCALPRTTVNCAEATTPTPKLRTKTVPLVVYGNAWLNNGS